MGFSIAAGVRATPEAEGWLILPGDMPLVLPATIQQEAAAMAEAAVAVPCYGRRRGHPVGFSIRCRDHLLVWFPVHELALDEPDCAFDIDTTTDFPVLVVVA